MISAPVNPPNPLTCSPSPQDHVLHPSFQTLQHTELGAAAPHARTPPPLFLNFACVAASGRGAAHRQPPLLDLGLLWIHPIRRVCRQLPHPAPATTPSRGLHAFLASPTASSLSCAPTGGGSSPPPGSSLNLATTHSFPKSTGDQWRSPRPLCPTQPPSIEHTSATILVPLHPPSLSPPSAPPVLRRAHGHARG